MFCIFLLFYIIYIVKAQIDCDSAPTESLKISCEQITSWDENTRSLAGSASSPLTPGIQGLGASAPPLPKVPTNAYDCMDISCICDFIQGTLSSDSLTCTVSGKPYTKCIRKEYRVMTDDERSKYHTAMWTIKNNGDYDELSKIHSSFQTSPGAHSGPAFLPWHREYIKRIEIALRKVDPSVCLPYWDSTLDGAITTPIQSVMWSSELMGMPDPTINNTVTTGAFRNWKTVDGSRTFARIPGKQGALLTSDDLDNIASNDFSQTMANTAPQRTCTTPASWAAFEYTHGNPHTWIGGDMLITTSSTNDPLFFNHHCFVDYLWEQWRINKQVGTGNNTADNKSNWSTRIISPKSPESCETVSAAPTVSLRETQYPTEDSTCHSSAHFGSATMQPFLLFTNKDGLSNRYINNLASYQLRPTCSSTNINGCNSKYLFCDLSHGTARCSTKIMQKGTCTGYTNSEQMCYLGECVSGICQAIQTTTAAPVQTTTPAVKTDDGTCFNENECCSNWASNGECTRNSRYMSSWCKAACNFCTPKYSTAECSDRHSMCSTFVSTGECTRNQAWMRENCRQSCGRCSITRAQACGGSSITGTTRPTTTTTTTVAPIPSSSCLNSDYCCIPWSLNGYCTSNIYKSFMAVSCRPACNYCTPPNGFNGPQCVDFNPSCPSWSRGNGCTKNAAYMYENCRLSCNRCDLVPVNARLRLCGFPSISSDVPQNNYPIFQSADWDSGDSDVFDRWSARSFVSNKRNRRIKNRKESKKIAKLARKRLEVESLAPPKGHSVTVRRELKLHNKRLNRDEQFPRLLIRQGKGQLLM